MKGMLNMKESLDYSASVKHLVEYFKGEVVVKRENEYKYLQAKKLLEVINIFESDVSLYQKIYQISLIYKNAEIFHNCFKKFMEYEKDPFLKPYLRKLNGIYKVYSACDREGITNDISYLVKFQNYSRTFNYCKFVISSYNNSDISFDTFKFCDFLGIDFDVFNYCVKVIKELDPELYEKYSAKAVENKEKRRESVLDKTNRLVSGIKNGVTEDGKPFTLIEFFKLLPFFNNDFVNQILSDFDCKMKSNYMLNLIGFFRTIYPEDSLVIDYIHKHRLVEKSFEPVNLNYIYSTKVSVNGRVITDEDNTQILSYMEENDIPMISRAYTEVRNQFLTDGLSNEETNVKRYIPKAKYTIVN